MNERWEEAKNRLKDHFRKHKATYSFGVGGVIFAGFTYVIMRSSGLRGGPCAKGLRGGPGNTASQFFNNKSTINITTVIEREGRGHPGWPVRNLETKQVFLTQKDAADAFNIPESLMSGHVNGKFPDIDGLHFERINLGVA